MVVAKHKSRPLILNLLSHSSLTMKIAVIEKTPAQGLHGHSLEDTRWDVDDVVCVGQRVFHCDEDDPRQGYLHLGAVIWELINNVYLCRRAEKSESETFICKT